MAYQIEYAYTCHIGKVRNNNEDNFWCCGESLDSENKGMSHVCSGHIKQADLPLLAVFDGMGGESCGEMAAFLAAESCGQYYKEKKKEFSGGPGTVHERTMQYNEPCSMSLWEGKQDKQHGDYSGYAGLRERECILL